jgi:hypothetical protein
MSSETGLGGAARFAQGKLAPFLRTGVGVASNTQYSGGEPIVGPKDGPISATYNELKYILSSAGPVPFGASTFLKYIQEEQDPSVLGSAGILTGTARYSKAPSKKSRNKPRPSAMDEIDKLIGGE